MSRRFGKLGAAVLSLAVVAIAYLAWRNGEFGDKAQQSEENGREQDGIHGSGSSAGNLKAEETGKPKRRLKVPERYMKELSRAEADFLGLAMGEYEAYLKEVEFRHAVLRWEVNREDRLIRLYELLPPSDEEMLLANTEIDRIMAKHLMNGTPRKAFAKWAPELLGRFLIPKGQNGSVFFMIPKNESLSILVDRGVGAIDIDSIVNELDASNGGNASLGGDSGEFMLLDNIDDKSRFSMYLETRSEE